MKDTVLARRNLINLVFTLIGLGLLIYTLYQGVTDYLQDQNGVEIDAKIESIETTTIGYSAHVSYKVEGKTYDQYHIDLGVNNKLGVGDTTKIKYNLHNPAKLVKNNHLILLCITGSISVIILIIFLPKRIKIIKNNANIRKLKKEGIKIEATVQDIIINNQAKQNNGFYPYRLRAKFLNPTDNQEYLFESADSYINPNDAIAKYQNKKVNVYVDKTNTKNYYVDLVSLIPEFEVVDPRQYMKEYYEKKKAEEEAARQAEIEAQRQKDIELGVIKPDEETENKEEKK